MLAGFLAAVGGANDLAAIGRSVVDTWCAAMARATEARSGDPALEGRIVDLAHRDVVSDPMAAIEHIYSRFDLPFSVQHRDRIARFLAENPAANRLGRHRHSPEQFGIDPAEVHARLAGYYTRYGHLFDHS